MFDHGSDHGERSLERLERVCEMIKVRAEGFVEVTELRPGEVVCCTGMKGPRDAQTSGGVATLDSTEVTMTRLPHQPDSRTICPECDGLGEYQYHRDPTGKSRPYHWDNPVGTGWHDGFWWKQCWFCKGTKMHPDGAG